MCLLPDSLKKTNSRFLWESGVPPAVIHVFRTDAAPVSPEAPELCLACQRLSSSPQKEYFLYLLFRGTDRAPGNKDSSKSLKATEIIPMESQPWNAPEIPGSGMMGHECQVCDKVDVGDGGMALALDAGQAATSGGFLKEVSDV